MDTKTKFYQKNWFIYLLLLLFPPVGIVLLWIFNKHSSKFKIIVSVISVIWFAFALTVDSTSKSDTSIKANNNTPVEVDNDVPASETAIIQQEDNDNTNKTLDKDAIQSAIEPLIPSEYKTIYYALDILTPAEGTGEIVSIQIENASFADKDTAVSAVVDIISSTMDLPEYDNIHSFEFTMFSDSQVKYIITLKDPSSINNTSEIRDCLTIKEA